MDVKVDLMEKGNVSEKHYEEAKKDYFKDKYVNLHGI